MWCHEIKIAPSKIAHICKNKVIDRSSSVRIILVFLKNFIEGNALPAINTIEYCMTLLEKVFAELEEEKATKVSKSIATWCYLKGKFHKNMPFFSKTSFLLL